jgi:3-isopropylmalate dehydrogenase
MAKISFIPGDGVGTEVTREAMKVLDVVAKKHRIAVSTELLDYGADRYLRDGTTLPAGEVERFRKEVDAIFLGAVGDPRVPDGKHARDILLGLRFQLDLFINLRPVRCLSDALCPLKDKRARDIDFVVFRENTEGAYVGMGGNFKKGTPDEVAINEDLNTRKGVERIIRAAFDYAVAHGRTRVTMSDKSNALRFAHDLWTRCFAEVARDYPKIETQHLYVDALVMELVRRPEMFQVVVTNNMFGDIVTDLGAALQGGMGMAGSGNINPKGTSLFEPVHGSAPDIAGKGVANPIASVLTVEMMLTHMGHAAAAKDVTTAVQKVIDAKKLTRDVGGSLSTAQVGDAIAEAI